MIYDIRHVTTYAYESPVSFARCALRLEPRSGDGQQLVSHSVDIKPRPADRTIRRDFFGTHTESILIEAPHRNLRIDSRSRVSVCRHAPGRTAPSPAWENVRDVAFEATSLGPSSPIGYVFASPLVPVQRPVTEYASASFPPGRWRHCRRGRSDAPDPHRIQIRPESDRDLDAAWRSVRKTPRRLPGLRSCDDRRPARPRTAGRLCQRLSAHHPAAGQTAAAGRRCDPCMGLAVVRRGDRLGRLRSDQ